MKLYITNKLTAKDVTLSRLYVTSEFDPQSFVIEGIPFFSVTDWVEHFIQDKGNRTIAQVEIANLVRMVQFPTPGTVVAIPGIPGYFADLVGCRSVLSDAMERAYTIATRKPTTFKGGRQLRTIPVENDRIGWSEVCKMSPAKVEFPTTAGFKWSEFTEINPSTLVKNKATVYGVPVQLELDQEGKPTNAEEMTQTIIDQYKRWYKNRMRKVELSKVAEESKEQEETAVEVTDVTTEQSTEVESKLSVVDAQKLLGSLTNNDSLLGILLKGKKLVLTIGLE